jgi:uncharacterized membrane protein (GlpM family)
VLSPLLEVILPFVFSFGIVILITMLAERFGTKIGGIAGTLPTTIVIAFLFIALNRGISFATHSVSIAVAEMAINVLFLATFAALSTRSLPTALIGSFSLWTFFTVLLYIADFTAILIPIILFAVAVAGCLWFLEKHQHVASQPQICMKYTYGKILLRGLLAGFVIAAAVSLSNLSIALSGILAMFPVIFLSTMLISYLEHGPLFTKALAKSLIFGSPSVVAYGAAIYFLYPLAGILTGTIGAVIISVAVSLVLFLLRSSLQ